MAGQKSIGNQYETCKYATTASINSVADKTAGKAIKRPWCKLQRNTLLRGPRCFSEKCSAHEEK
ncbi:MAG: hypothetical protein HY811_08290 [Planctomycetes bacterium]|nr:hypothetical protein [Planctomycetota bacterium]